MAQLENVQSSGDNFTGELDGYDVGFGRVKEPGAMRFNSQTQQDYYAAKYWWFTTKKEPKKVYILKDKPEEGRSVNLDRAIAVLDRDAISY